MDATRTGRALRALRRQRGWRQRDLAARTGLSKSTIGRLELGQLEGATLGTLAAVVRALGATIDVGVRWNGEALDRLLDAAHAAIVERLIAMLREFGWEIAPEVSYSIGGERGSVDVLAWHPEVQIALIVEVKSVVPDLQATLHGLDRKARIGPILDRERGWLVRGVARLLVIGETRTNRRRLDTHAATVAAALPTSGRAVLTWLRSPHPPALSGRLFLSSAREEGRMGGGRHRVRLARADTSVGGRSSRATIARRPASGQSGGSSATAP